MRINVYAEEMPDLEDRDGPAVQRFEKEADTGVTYFGVRIFLKSPDDLHDTPGDDDRSAITFWGPRAKVAFLLRRAAHVMEKGNG